MQVNQVYFSHLGATGLNMELLQVYISSRPPNQEDLKAFFQ